MIWAHSPDFPYWGIYYDDNDDQMRWQGDSYIMTVDFMSGHVGINTQNPVAQLDVQAEGGYSAVYGYRNDNNNFGILGYDSDGVYGWTPNDHQSGVRGNTSGNFSMGVRGTSSGSGGCGIEGKTTNAQGYAGVFWTDVGNGVLSEGHWYGFKGISSGGYGVLGQNTPSGNYGYLGTSYWAGYFSGDVHVDGDLSASGSKPFVQPHRDDPSKEIVYISAEAPEAVVLLRGTAQLKDGDVTIEIPEHFRMVAAEEGVQVQVTPIEDCNGMFVANKSHERIEVRELMGGKHNAKFDYLITAVRAGFEEHQAVTENKHFKPGENESAEDFEKRFSKDDMSTRATQALLISNGILTEDGKLNMAKVSELGWTLAEDNPDADAALLAELHQR
jgi:hypothetical protein